ncbi:MAG TPA: hypothetical protein VFJ02_18315 [Vicinamibacterales bacterium]|nr:hypothetical protein [Vicinamibacterales bacterium]
MTRRRSLLLVAAILSVSLTGFAPDSVRAIAPTLPDKLSDHDYWALVTELSEPNGEFRSDNLLSNEIFLQYVIPELARPPRLNRVYMGVGPEQNFTYIAALKPKMAFIVDIRRGNLQLHLMYKALFELSSDRADFVFKLFSRKRPEGLGAKASAQDIFEALEQVDQSEAQFKENLKIIQDHLTKKRGLPLSAEDLRGIEYVHGAFSWYGPGLSYWSTGGRGGSRAPTYWDLMVADDGKGQTRSFLSSDENFQVLKDLHEKNLLVPVVGNFAGPKAIRAVGRYLKDREAIVAAFYLSNVEQYLSRENNWYTFCANVSTLPLDSSSTFIRSVRNSTYGPGVGLDSELGNISEEVKSCAVR